MSKKTLPPHSYEIHGFTDRNGHAYTKHLRAHDASDAKKRAFWFWGIQVSKVTRNKEL